MAALDRVSTICPEDTDKATEAFEKMKSTGKAEAEVKSIRKTVLSFINISSW